MFLPNRRNAVVDDRRLTQYLLAADHPRGRHKAVFFGRLGYWPLNADALRVELLRIAAVNEVAETTVTRYGTTYVIDGVIQNRAGGSVPLRTVWFIDRGAATPRLLTAYPP